VALLECSLFVNTQSTTFCGQIDGDQIKDFASFAKKHQASFDQKNDNKHHG